MDLDEYDTLEINNPVVHMTAGSLAGIMEHSVMYPIDSVKTRMQSLIPYPEARYKGITEALYKMMRYEGILRPMRGISIVVIGAGPAHALYFSCYEYSKSKFTNLFQSALHQSHLAHGIAGALATLLHDSIMIPVEVKQRMQMYSSPYSSNWQCLVRILKTEGYYAFYRAYPTQLIMNIPFQSMHFMTYEVMQNLLNAERLYNPTTHLISGAIAGAAAATLTTPLDVCKTLLNTQENLVLVKSQKGEVPGILTAGRLIYQLVGFPGFFSGMTARICFQAPATAITWCVYEFFKYFIIKNN